MRRLVLLVVPIPDWFIIRAFGQSMVRVWAALGQVSSDFDRLRIEGVGFGFGRVRFGSIGQGRPYLVGLVLPG